MKERNFDWMFQGCHPLSEVAQAYYPCEHNSSSIRSFRKHVKELPKLYADLLEAGYTDKTTMLTPLQIAAIIRGLELPIRQRRRLKSPCLNNRRHLSSNLRKYKGYILIYPFLVSYIIYSCTVSCMDTCSRKKIICL